MLKKAFRTGETIPVTGIYRVSHAAHRLPHDCTLIEGYAFPRCSKCGDAVHFEVVATAPLWRSGPTRTVIIYELPELPPDQTPEDPQNEDVA